MVASILRACLQVSGLDEGRLLTMLEPARYVAPRGRMPVLCPLVTQSVTRWDVAPPECRHVRPWHDGTMSSVEGILAGLDDEQRLAVTAPQAPLVIVAGAGTGKTRTITHRIAYLVTVGAADPSSILAVTHSTKAAGELRDRLQALGAPGVSARTFHAAALAFLRKFWAATGRDHDLSLLDNRYPLVRRALEQVAGRRPGRAGQRHFMKAVHSSDLAEPAPERVFDFASEIGWAKASLIAPSRYTSTASAAGRVLPAPAEIVAAVYQAYEELKARDAKLDFEDLLTMGAEILETNADVADVVRAGFRTFVVDEYQDTDPAQYRFLEALRGGHRDLCVVGDPRQSIYTFKGADPSILERFTTAHPDATVVTLVRDYRSTPEIVATANRVMPAARAEALVGMQPSGPAPRVYAAYDEGAEEREVIRQIRRLLATGTRAKEIAILYRFNAQSARFEAALTTAGIGYRVADTERFFERPEIRQPLVAFGRAARMDPETAGAVLLHQMLADHGFDPHHPPEGAGASRSRFDAQLALVEMVEAMPGSAEWTAAELLEELNRRAKESHAPTPDGVTLSTLHRAKGLEYDAVFLVALTEGSMPSMYATAPEHVEEERRLFYVGITRARKFLHLSWSERRPGPSGAQWTAKPSRFLDLITVPDVTVPDVTATDSPASRARPGRSAGLQADDRVRDRRSDLDVTVPGAASCERCRAGLRGLAARRLGRCSPGCLAGPDAELHRALVAWREATATPRTASDRALFTLVAMRPRTLDELRGIAGLDKHQVDTWAPELIEIVATHLPSAVQAPRGAGQRRPGVTGAWAARDR